MSKLPPADQALIERSISFGHTFKAGIHVLSSGDMALLFAAARKEGEAIAAARIETLEDALRTISECRIVPECPKALPAVISFSGEDGEPITGEAAKVIRTLLRCLYGIADHADMALAS